MKKVSYTCDECGVTERAEDAEEWGHYKRRTADRRVDADFCSEPCHWAWVKQETDVKTLPLFADRSAASTSTVAR